MKDLRPIKFIWISWDYNTVYELSSVRNGAVTACVCMPENENILIERIRKVSVLEKRESENDAVEECILYFDQTWERAITLIRISGAEFHIGANSTCV